MSSSNIILITACDAAYSDLAEDLIDSFRLHYGMHIPIGLFVTGKLDIADRIINKVDIIVYICEDYQYKESIKGFYESFICLKPRIPEYFPNFDYYLWVDADCWFGNSQSIDRILKLAEAYGIAIHPEYDVHYRYNPTPSPRTKRIYEQNYKHEITNTPLNMPMLNSGVFCMRNTSRIWELWKNEMYSIKERFEKGDDVFFCDQISLHKVIYQSNILFGPMRAIDNWQLYAASPAYNTIEKVFMAPTDPWEQIGIMHLAGGTKDQEFRIEDKLMKLRYRTLRESNII